MGAPVQFDVFRLSDRTLVVVLQSDLMDHLRARVVAPLLRHSDGGTATRGLNPVMMVGDVAYVLKPELMSAVPIHELTTRVGSASDRRDDIIRALDLLFTGI